MKKYILHGGYLRKATNEQNLAFCKELIKGIPIDEKVKILICEFARPSDARGYKFEENKNIFIKYLKNVDVFIADPDNFLRQIEESQIVFFDGGETDLLKNILDEYPEWNRKMIGKIFAGSSAGAQIISKYYYGLNSLKIEEALGILPIKIIVHWDSDFNQPNINWDKALKELKDYKENLPVHALKEGEYIVIES